MESIKRFIEHLSLCHSTFKRSDSRLLVPNPPVQSQFSILFKMLTTNVGTVLSFKGLSSIVYIYNTIQGGFPATARWTNNVEANVGSV